MVVRRRLDVELVRRGLMSSQEMAQRAIDERRVLVGGALAERSARQVDAAEPIERWEGFRPKLETELKSPPLPSAEMVSSASPFPGGRAATGVDRLLAGERRRPRRQSSGVLARRPGLSSS